MFYKHPPASPRVPPVTHPSQATNHKCEEPFLPPEQGAEANPTAGSTCCAEPRGAVAPSLLPRDPRPLPLEELWLGAALHPTATNPLRAAGGSPTLISTSYGLQRKKDKARWAGNKRNSFMGGWPSHSQLSGNAGFSSRIHTQPSLHLEKTLE